jgi:hypothetical protein
MRPLPAASLASLPSLSVLATANLAGLARLASLACLPIPVTWLDASKSAVELTVSWHSTKPSSKIKTIEADDSYSKCMPAFLSTCHT